MLSLGGKGLYIWLSCEEGRKRVYGGELQRHEVWETQSYSPLACGNQDMQDQRSCLLGPSSTSCCCLWTGPKDEDAFLSRGTDRGDPRMAYEAAAEMKGGVVCATAARVSVALLPTPTQRSKSPEPASSSIGKGLVQLRFGCNEALSKLLDRPFQSWTSTRCAT